jgi:hypothetical protein
VVFPDILHLYLGQEVQLAAVKRWGYWSLNLWPEDLKVCLEVCAEILAICTTRKKCVTCIVSRIKKFLTAKQPENQWVFYRIMCVWMYIFRGNIYTMWVFGVTFILSFPNLWEI